MSGGSYDYAYTKVDAFASSVRERHRDKPHVVALANHLDAIAKAMHDIEWCDSLDYSWDDEDVHASIRAVVSPEMELRAALDWARDAQVRLGQAIERATAVLP